MLNDASERIGTTLDLARTAEELAQVIIEQLADFVVVDVLDSVLSGEEARRSRDGELLVFRRVAQHSVLPGCPESVVRLGAPLSYHVRSPTGRALATGHPPLNRVDTENLDEWAAGTPERAASIRKHGIHSILTVPLRARGLTLGVTNLSRHRTLEPFDEGDLRLAEELASRAAVCIDNARRYARERATALSLQRTLLPEHAPRQVGSALDVASRYCPQSRRSASVATGST
ncbi:GAF domain-containing protein [Streptomyces sp. NPDC057257]|uniref:GAF domain-containing protein n=1 Tax=Streptomyces sp. NPDC057257 TaxID=3346071 RepID=UPI00363B53B3